MIKDIQHKNTFLVGIISDTHNLLRPEAIAALRGSDLIIHAGDVGRESLLDGLRTIAPVAAVRGNTDRDQWAYKLRRTEILKLNGTGIYVIHNIDLIDLDPVVSGISVVVSGHLHMPSVSRRKGVLYINPGSAGPKRPDLPVSVALLRLEGQTLNADIVRLDCLTNEQDIW
ncbi:MAG: metallophosphoesterase family protein [Nitrospirae bacterium]|nr:metallophosphoesterase family protein [Nitrospirota bacterium]